MLRVCRCLGLAHLNGWILAPPLLNKAANVALLASLKRMGQPLKPLFWLRSVDLLSVGLASVFIIFSIEGKLLSMVKLTKEQEEAS